MLTSDDLAMIRAAFERYLASTAELNRIFMAAWNKAGAEARQEFLERIDVPVFDRNAA